MIPWDESAPQNTDRYQDLAGVLRSLKTNLSGALGSSFYWPGTAGGSAASAGQALPGSIRAFYAAQSAYSAPSSSSSGALFVASDTSRLFGGGSSLSLFLGSASAVEGATLPGGARVRWVTSLTTGAVVDVNGTFGTSDQTIVNVVWSNGNFPAAAGYDVAPVANVGLWLETPGGKHAVQGMMISTSTITTGGASFVLSVLSRATTGPSVSTCTVHVLVIGQGTLTI